MNESPNKMPDRMARSVVTFRFQFGRPWRDSRPGMIGPPRNHQAEPGALANGMNISLYRGLQCAAAQRRRSACLDLKLGRE